jgi:hypothetical protein
LTKPIYENIYLYNANTRPNVHQQVRKDIWICGLELKLWLSLVLVLKGFIRNIFQEEVTPFDQALNLVFLVYPEKERDKDEIRTQFLHS